MNLETQLDPRLWRTIESAYQSRNYTAAILDAIHLLGQLIRDKSGLEEDGLPLVNQAFGGKKPILKITPLQTETDLNIQEGVAQILRGVYQGIRNPRSHEKFTDSEQDADAIVLLVNYLVGQIDKARSPFERTTFFKRVFESWFVEDKRYAEVLVKEIPPGKRLNIAIEAFRRRRSTNNVSKLSYFFEELLNTMEEDDVAGFADVVSDELRRMNSDIAIQTTLDALPMDFWPRLSAAARIRIENRLIQSIRSGRYNAIEDDAYEGWLGTWASSIADHFSLRKELVEAITSKLLSNKIEERAYAMEFFFSRYQVFPTLQPIPSPEIRTYILERLNSGDGLVYAGLHWLEEYGASLPAWKEAFLAARIVAAAKVTP